MSGAAFMIGMALLAGGICFAAVLLGYALDHGLIAISKGLGAVALALLGKKGENP